MCIFLPSILLLFFSKRATPYDVLTQYGLEWAKGVNVCHLTVLVSLGYFEPISWAFIVVFFNFARKTTYVTASCSRSSQSALQLFKLTCFAVFNHFIAPKLPRVIQCIRFSHPPTSLTYIMRRNPQKSRIFIHWEKNPQVTSINSLRTKVHMKISCHSNMWEHV